MRKYRGIECMHLTVRMAWHDNNWNGKVCLNPEGNPYCVGTHSLLSDRIASNRKLEIESEYKDSSIDMLPNDYIPPCYWSINAFSPEYIDIVHEHPFKNIKHSIPEKMKPYSFFTWPFKLSFVHKEENKKKYGDYPPDLEKRVDDFINKFTENQSIVFFYANYDNPVSADEMKYLLLGCSVISEKPKKTYFPFSNEELDKWRSSKKMKYFPSLNWALQFTHDFEQYGVLLPYREYLDYVEKNPEDEEKLHEMKVVIDESSLVNSFKYVAMDIDDDKCLYLLYKLRKSLLKIEEHGFIASLEKTKQQLQKIEKLIRMTWEKRGLYPSLSKILTYFDVDAEDAKHIAEYINANAVNQKLGELFEQLEQERVPDGLSDYEDTLLDLFENRSFKRNLERLKKLSMLNLTDYQIEKIINDPDLFQEIEQNPYILFEKYRADENDLDEPNLQDEPIDIFKIDIALIPDRKYVAKDRDLQKMQADSPERLRAVIIQHLYEIGNLSGDCFETDKKIIEHLKQYPLFYKSDIKIDEFALMQLDDDYRKHFIERLHIELVDNQHFYYLKETKFAENVIKNAFNTLSQKKHNHVQIDLNNYIKESAATLKDKNPEFDDELFINERTKLYNNVFKQSFYLLTGRAGAGKTEETANIIEMLSVRLGEEVTVLAPTGKAALRLADKLNSPKYRNNVKPKTIDKFIFENNFQHLIAESDYTAIENVSEREKVVVDNLIVDECSMVDLFKLAILFTIIRLDKIKRVILVGDEFQLPPIGFGKPFRDLIDFVSSNKQLADIHYIRLESNCRIAEKVQGNNQQTESNKILELADVFASKKRYYEPILQEVSKNGFESSTLSVHIWKNKDDLKEMLESELNKLLRSYVDDFDPDNLQSRIKAFNIAFGLYDNGHVPNWSAKEIKLDAIQLLSPYRAGHYGTIALNKNIQIQYRKPNRYRNDVFFHSDKIMRLYNWYKWNGAERKKELVLSNGSIGIVTHHRDKENRNKTIKRYFFSELNDVLEKIDEESNFDLAYAITVHKSQGSDFEHVFLVIPKKFSLLSKEMIYTALTRAKKKLFLFVQENQEKSLLEIAKNISFVDGRNTSIFDAPEDRKTKFQPKKGVFVKSKVEYIIYKVLEKSGLKFEYENELKLDNRTYNIHPDFTITLSDGRKIFWEHLGMLDTQKYFQDWQRRKDDYKAMGLYDDLITTDDLGGINEEKLQTVIEDIRNRSLINTLNNPFSNHHYTLY